MVRVYEAQAARYTPAGEPGWLDSTDAGGRAVRAALLLLGFLLVPVAFPLVWFVLGDCKGQDRTAGGGAGSLRRVLRGTHGGAA